MIDIQKLEELAKAATQGQWRHGKNSDDVVADHPAGHEQDQHEIDYYGGHLVAESISGNNRDFIAAANPAAVLELIRATKVAKLQMDIQRHLAAGRGEERDRVKIENEKLKTQLAEQVMHGYAGAFYQMAEKLGITGARAESPQQVFETEVMPALLALIAERDRLGADNRALAEDPGSAL